MRLTNSPGPAALLVTLDGSLRPQPAGPARARPRTDSRQLSGTGLLYSLAPVFCTQPRRVPAPNDALRGTSRLPSALSLLPQCALNSAAFGNPAKPYGAGSRLRQRNVSPPISDPPCSLFRQCSWPEIGPRNLTLQDIMSCRLPFTPKD